MQNIQIWHNPKCSKSRAAMELLENKNIDANVVEYLKLTQNIEYLKYVLALKWFIIIFNSLLSIYLILTLFKNSENQEKSSVKKDKVETKNSFNQRETELLHKKKLINKAENIIKNR